MAQNITLLGASYSAVPAVRLPKTGGGTADFTDVSDTTATASDVAQGKYFYTSSGERTVGTASGGGGNIGGLANMVDVNNAEYAFAFMLSQMKNGETVGGTVTYSGAFKNTEQLVLSTGLSTIHGFMFACPTYDMTTSLGTGQSNKFFMAMLHSYQETPAHYWVMGFSQSNASANAPNRVLETQYNATPENGTFRISGGDIYYTARYNKNANYQFVRPNVQYEWLAW